jgi:hypothetical protein
MNLIKTIVKKYMSGMRTKETIETYNELLVEANTQLGIIRLDESYRKYEKKVTEVIKESLVTTYGEDPEKIYKNTIIKMYNQIKGIDPYIIKDGSEPELRESDIFSTDIQLFQIEDAVFPNEQVEKDKYEKLKKNIEASLESNNLSHEERNKLIMIKELGENMKNQTLICSSQLTFELFENKTIEQLKNMDIQEMGKYEYRMSEEGQLTTSTLYENNQIEKMEKDMDVICARGKDFFDELLPEKKFEQKFDRLFNKMTKEDKERADKIASALNMGQYIDDPIYIEILMREDKYIKLREKFLKEYYSGKSKVGNNTLLKTYMDKGGDIIEQMNMDGIFYKFDSETGKEISRMWEDYFREVDQEELADDPSKIDQDDIEEEELTENVKPTLQSIMQENMNILKEGQETFRHIIHEQENPVGSSSADDKYIPGRKKNNKKMKNKH